jgi:uncharacterized protein involved in response to NO
MPAAAWTARWQRLTAQPVFMCGFRPFFLLTGASAVLLVLAWTAMLAGALPMPQVPGGPIAWHAHELIFGFAMASVAGFLLTAVPEFTGTREAPAALTLRLVLLWLAARTAYPLAPWLSIVPAAAFNGLLAVWLLAVVVPPILHDPERRHVGIAVTVALLAVVQVGYFAALIGSGDAMRWLHAATGLLMILVVLAQSRISLRVVNGAVERPQADAGYRPRPPRVNLAIGCIGLYTALEWLQPGHAASGWLALAAAAAMLNLLNDWHIGRALFARWALLLYAVYWLLAAGYGLLAAAHFGAPIAPSAGRHLLLAGAMSLAILVVMNIAGRIHAGQWLDRRAWVWLAAVALIAGAILRAAGATAWFGGAGLPLLVVAALLWSAGFVLYLVYSARTLLVARADGKTGCAEPDPPAVPIVFMRRPQGGSQPP